MNPFDWSGPDFLRFFGVFCVVVVFASYLWRVMAEQQTGSRKLRLVDPYLIAYLRAETFGAITLAISSLMDRGLLTLEVAGYVATPGYNKDSVRSVELAVLTRCQLPTPGSSLIQDHGATCACLPYEQALMEQGLLVSDSIRASRFARFLVALSALVAVAGIKLIVAMSRGKHNVGYLIVMVIGFAVAAALVSFPSGSLTSAGKAALKDARGLFEGLRSRADTIMPQKTTTDLEYLVASFGMYALPPTAFPWARELERSAPPSARPGSGSSCGTFWGSNCSSGSGASSCGSSSGSSCGSSCGGGGCGGGCGGCGS